LHEPHVDFVYPSEGDEESARESRVLESLLNWLFPAGGTPDVVLLRSHVLAYAIRPQWLGDDAHNVAALSRRLGVSRARLGHTLKKFNEAFGFQTAGQRGPDARKKYAANARRNAAALSKARRAAATKAPPRPVANLRRAAPFARPVAKL